MDYNLSRTSMNTSPINASPMNFSSSSGELSPLDKYLQERYSAVEAQRQNSEQSMEMSSASLGSPQPMRSSMTDLERNLASLNLSPQPSNDEQYWKKLVNFTYDNTFFKRVIDTKEDVQYMAVALPTGKALGIGRTDRNIQLTFVAGYGKVKIGENVISVSPGSVVSIEHGVFFNIRTEEQIGNVLKFYVEFYPPKYPSDYAVKYFNQ
jgi:mannose-6-phosphate isomerase-like protein (cupin superfamily)